MVKQTHRRKGESPPRRRPRTKDAAAPRTAEQVKAVSTPRPRWLRPLVDSRRCQAEDLMI